MKANEAPEIIYRTTTYLDNDKGKTVWKETPVKGAENIEYIRKDAFIEKTSWWIEKNIKKWYKNIKTHGFRMTPLMITELKKYMEGE